MNEAMPKGKSSKVTLLKGIGQEIKEERFLWNAVLTGITEEKEVRLLCDKKIQVTLQSTL